MNNKLGLKNLDDPRRQQYPKYVLPKSLPTLPASLDLRSGYTEVGDQNPWGTCVDFSTGKVFEYFYAKAKNQKIIISKSAILSLIKSTFYPGDTNDDGAQVSDGLTILERGYLLSSERPYNYNNFEAMLAPVDQSTLRTDFEFKNFVVVQPQLQDMKLALINSGPLCIGISWMESWMDIGTDGKLPAPDKVAGGHAISICGYDDNIQNLDGSLGAFFIQNNWTETWGDKGYCYLPYTYIYLIRDIFTVQT